MGIIDLVAGAISALLAIALLNGSNVVRCLFGIGAVINMGAASTASSRCTASNG